MNEAIGYSDDDVSANWEELLHWMYHTMYIDLCDLDLSDSKADLYDFSNELLMRTMRERLLETLQTQWNDVYEYNGYHVTFGNKFFEAMNEQQQRSFLRRIVAYPATDTDYNIFLGEEANSGAEKPAITLCTAALLDVLTDLSPHVSYLNVSNFALSNQSDVEALSNIMLTKGQYLLSLELRDIEYPINCGTRHEDELVGFFDPLLYTISCLKHLKSFGLSARTNPSYSSLVSSNAVCAVLLSANFQGKLNFELHLEGLGLNNSHCLAIVEVLQTADTLILKILDLDGNPHINAEGYSALLDLINGTNVIDHFYLDDKTWEGKLNLVSEMNRFHGRRQYLTDGTFTSERRRWQWLQKLASLPNPIDVPGHSFHREEWETFRNKEKWEARCMNYILYELVEHPEFMRT